MTIKSFRDLEVWQQSIELVDLVYNVTRQFPEDERFGLISQMRRAAASVPSNIAEGHTRQHRPEYIQFCHIALSSCAELETQATIAKRRRFAPETELNILEDLLETVGRRLSTLVKRLKNKS